MTWLESFVTKLAGRVDKQLDEALDKKAFAAAQDAYIAGDFKTAIAGYQALAEKNHGQAATLAGTMHLMGTGTKENGALALKYLEIGRNTGDLAAISMLGLAYAAGKAGVKVDYVKARPLLEAAVKNGDAKAQQMLDLVKGKQRGKRK